MKNIKILIFIFFPIHMIAQNNSGDVKKSLRFNIGTEYRITPIYNVDSDFSDVTSFTNVDFQNSGLALIASLECRLTNRFYLGYGNGFRYDLVISPMPLGNNRLNVGTADYKLIVEHHFYVGYEFKVFRNNEFFVNFGISLMNRNTDFSVKEVFDVGEGFSINNFTYGTNKLSVGYSTKRANFYLGMYFTRQTPFFDQTTFFMVPHIGLSYKL
ncbi:hypothetical protein [Flagellimonas pacifica]|uniref:Outer membrane protein beta-barrel domain-containing protein n=1 Tax=Flagellimonas pacifica TaxID=1247520 RepID=A0A285MTT7_9FLAO|nr:hypothetical protein [Allomuricauda parva]SNZ00605.1 hypothetical protein SAMN06265377_2430 [Allomuricauda parva]